MRPLLAVRTRNCAKFIRVSYYFDFEFQKSHLQIFNSFNLELNEFSKFSHLAKDHFTLASFEPAILISGVIGEKCFDVAYGKFTKSEEDQESTIADFEKFLIAQKFGEQLQRYDKKTYHLNSIEG